MAIADAGGPEFGPGAAADSLTRKYKGQSRRMIMVIVLSFPARSAGACECCDHEHRCCVAGAEEEQISTAAGVGEVCVPWCCLCLQRSHDVRESVAGKGHRYYPVVSRRRGYADAMTHEVQCLV